MQAARRETASSARQALRITSLFSIKRPILGITEIARLMDLPKSNVSRLVGALVSEHFLARTVAGRYRLGLRLHDLGEVASRSHELYGPGLSALIEVNRATGESAHFGVIDGLDVIDLMRLQWGDIAKANNDLWKRSTVYAHASSVGKLLLAFSSSEKQEQVIANGLHRLTAKTITEPSLFREELARIRASAYALCREEHVEGICSIAVPIFNSAGAVIAAIAVASQAHRLNQRRIKSILSVLRRTAAAVAGDETFAHDIDAAISR
jgi:DNA-binding IclR family transcriptional regulator